VRATAPHSPLAKARARRLKRALDLIVGVPLAVVATPVLLLLILLVKLTSRGPAFFKQHRVGQNGSHYVVYKLRTMHRLAERHLDEDEELQRLYRTQGFKLHVDPRVTRLGRYLRKCSLDELPQIFQVVAGSMSLVGPRPVLPAEITTLYGSDADLYLLVKPGLTGAWQVGGRSTVRGPQRAILDLAYVRNWSLRSDLAILLRTFKVVLTQHGAV
jgi:lipopolysaccharide/colanic/teichoic acid biosynthesis glycosyltransferase